MTRGKTWIVGATGVVLAGGASRRMGCDKAFLRFQGKPVVELVVGVLRELFPAVMVVTDRLERYAGLRVQAVADIVAQAGPLGGLHTALRNSRTEANFVVACDMPFLDARFISHMLRLPRDYDVLVPRIGEYLEPLHAVYTKACLPAIEGKLKEGDFRVRSFFPLVRVRHLDEAEMRRFDPALMMFANLNEAGDFRRAKEALRRHAHQQASPCLQDRG